MDIEWALHELRSFEQMTVLTNDSRRGLVSIYSSTAAPDRDVTLAAPAVEEILDRVIPDWRTSIELQQSNRWTRHRETTLRAIALLHRREELREKLGDNAPTLDVGRLHPWVWDGARSMWGSEHYRAAVGDAARKVNAETQRKYGTRELSEKDLFLQAFSDDEPKPSRPRLRLPDDDDGKSATSLRRGIRTYAEGCFAALRNPAAHDVLRELLEHEALEQLAAFSVLARWVDVAQVITAAPDSTA